MYKHISTGKGPLMIPGVSCVQKFVEVHKVMLRDLGLLDLTIDKFLSLHHLHACRCYNVNQVKYSNPN